MKHGDILVVRIRIHILVLMALLSFMGCANTQSPFPQYTPSLSENYRYFLDEKNGLGQVELLSGMPVGIETNHDTIGFQSIYKYEAIFDGIKDDSLRVIQIFRKDSICHISDTSSIHSQWEVVCQLYHSENEYGVIVPDSMMLKNVTYAPLKISIQDITKISYAKSGQIHNEEFCLLPAALIGGLIAPWDEGKFDFKEFASFYSFAGVYYYFGFHRVKQMTSVRDYHIREWSINVH